jgi:hypothetical protein
MLHTECPRNKCSMLEGECYQPKLLKRLGVEDGMTTCILSLPSCSFNNESRSPHVYSDSELTTCTYTTRMWLQASISNVLYVQSTTVHSAP